MRVLINKNVKKEAKVIITQNESNSEVVA